VLPVDIWDQIKTTLTSEITEYNIHEKLRTKTFLKGIITNYSRNCSPSSSDLENFVNKLMTYESGYALVTAYLGVGSSFTQEITAGDEGFVYVLSGQGYFSSDGAQVNAGQVGHLIHTSVIDGPTTLSVSAKKPTRFLLWTGKPLRQPVVARGPFVMNAENQIAEAFADYRVGLFGSIPLE
jgi:redox-sensitive bicupin YhaK (pirin superfamily)